MQYILHLRHKEIHRNIHTSAPTPNSNILLKPQIDNFNECYFYHSIYKLILLVKNISTNQFFIAIVSGKSGSLMSLVFTEIRHWRYGDVCL